MIAARRGEQGFIIVAVLWICAALSALVLIYLNFVTGTAQATAANTERPQVEALIGAGVELTALRILSSDKRPASGEFQARIGPNRIAVTFIAESARIDLNAAPKRLLANLFIALGASAEAAEPYADRILAWRAPADDGDTEAALYRTLGMAYGPRRAPFPVAEELWRVAGIPDQFIARALPHLTTFSNQAAADPAIADPFVAAAMQGEGSAASSPKAYRIAVAATLANAQRSASEAVILVLDGAAEPYRVLAWRDLYDDAPQQAAAR